MDVNYNLKTKYGNNMQRIYIFLWQAQINFPIATITSTNYNVENKPRRIKYIIVHEIIYTIKFFLLTLQKVHP